MASTRFALDVPARCASAGTLAPDVPLCLVFGWVNARDAHVKKYTDALTRELECCATVRATMPTARAFSPLERSRVAYVTEALTFARRAYGGRTPRKVYLFCFSNGGCWVQATLARARAEGTIARELMFDFEGVIFDSCPAFMSMKSGGDALTAVMRQPLALVVRVTFYALVSVLATAHLMHGDVRSNVDEEVLDDDAEHAERKEGVVYLFPERHVDGFAEARGVNCSSSEKLGKRQGALFRAVAALRAFEGASGGVRQGVARIHRVVGFSSM